MDNSSLNVLSLCAGAGGLDLGVSIAEPRARVYGYIEWEAYAAAVLLARMEDQSLDPAPVWCGDIRDFDVRPFRGHIDMVISGDPCQPNSVAGKGLGADDDRWLLDRVLQIFNDSGADRFFRENVSGNASGQLAVLIPALEKLGCRVACGIFSAAEAGASHRRERLFVLADRAGGRRAEGRTEPARRLGLGASEFGHGAMAQPDDDGRQPGRLHPRQRRSGQGTAEPDGVGEAMGDAEGGAGRCKPESQGGNRAGSAGAGRQLADAGGARSQGQRPGEQERWGEPVTFCADGAEIPLHAPGPADPRWPGIVAEYPALEPAVRRVADGLAGKLVGGDRVDRLRLTGNGVVPLQAAFAYSCLQERLRCRDE